MGHRPKAQAKKAKREAKAEALTNQNLALAIQKIKDAQEAGFRRTQGLDARRQRR